MPEFAALIGIQGAGVRKMLSGKTQHAPFPISGPESPLIVESEKRRFIDVDRLPSRFFDRLLPEQRELLDQMLAVQMGSTPWGGRRAVGRRGDENGVGADRTV